MGKPGTEVKPPSAILLALEPRGLLSFPALLAASPFLAAAPRGPRHAVIVLLGLGADDRSTVVIRRFSPILATKCTAGSAAATSARPAPICRRSSRRSSHSTPRPGRRSRSDGVVAWRACREEEGPDRENVEVRTTHTGLGFHPAALWVIADRLAQTPGTWEPFRPGPLVAPFFPPPARP
jgi:hypothetical protein